jgi:plastocyanin
MIALTRLFRVNSSLVRMVVLASLAAPSMLAGTVAVQVRDASSSIEDAVVYALPDGRVPPPTRQTAIMDQRDRMFIPHVLAIQTGTAVQFPNSDDIRHHVYSFSPAKHFQLPLYKGNPASPVVFDKAGVVTLGCNIHDRMTAFIVIVDTPWFTITDGSGRGELTGLPEGTYALHVWYPDMKRSSLPIDITIDGDEQLSVPLVVGREAKDGDGSP